MSNIFTIHRQPYGEVMNPVSADGVRFYDKDGDITEVRMIDGMVNIHVGRVTVSAEHLEDLMRPPSAPVGVPVGVVREYLDARACYNPALQHPNSPEGLRLREARNDLDAALYLAQQPSAAPALPLPGDRGSVQPLFNPQPPAEAQPCGCGEATCTVPWEPGCGLGKSEQHAEALRCTCPSGDGSLRWPCPAHPPEAQPVAWSTDKPKRPGVYGVRGFNLCRGPEEQFEAIVSVLLYQGDLICNLHESTSEDDFDRWAPIEDCHDGFEWCEFVPANLPPSAPEAQPVGTVAVSGVGYTVKWTCAPPSLGTPLYAHPPPEALVGVEARSMVMSNELYSLLTDVSNGIDSPATCGIASRLVCQLDRARDALAQQQQQGGSDGR